MTFPDLWHQVLSFRLNSAAVPMWYAGGDEEPAELYRLADKAPGPIVELGTYCGTGAACLAAGAKGKQAVYTVDPARPGWDRGHNATGTHHGGHCTTERSIETARALWEHLGLTAAITAVEEPCESEAALAACPAEIGLLFVDAEHQPAILEQHLNLWAPRVMAGGYLVLHDWGIPGNEFRTPGAMRWDVAGVAQRYVDATAGSIAWSGPHLVRTLAWYRADEVAT